MIGVAGHASSEFFAKLGGAAGPETSVWRYLLGGFGLILWALWDRDSRELITPLRQEGLNILGLSIMGVTVANLFFHSALDYATVIQVATVTSTIWGVLLATGCAALGSFYGVLVKPVMARHGGPRIIALTMTIGCIGLWLLVGSALGDLDEPGQHRRHIRACSMVAVEVGDPEHHHHAALWGSVACRRRRISRGPRLSSF